MIQINAFESIASDLNWSIANINKNSGKEIFFNSNQSKSVKFNPKVDNIFLSNVETDENIFDMDNNLSREKKSISRSMIIGCHDNDLIIGKKSSLRELNNLCFGMNESNLLEDFQLDLLRKGNFKNRNRKRRNILKLSTSEEIVNEKSKSLASAKSSNFVSQLINRLKQDFQEPENFVPGICNLPKWKPIFFSNRINDREQQLLLKNVSRFGPDEPTINSIGLKYNLSTANVTLKKEETEKKTQIQEIFKNKFWLDFFNNQKPIKTQSLQNISNSKITTIKCNCIQCTRNSLKSFSETKIHTTNSFLEIQENSRKIRRQRRRRNIQMRISENFIVKNGNSENSYHKFIDGKFGKFAKFKSNDTSSSDDEWKNCESEKNWKFYQKNPPHWKKEENGKIRENSENCKTFENVEKFENCENLRNREKSKKRNYFDSGENLGKCYENKNLQNGENCRNFANFVNNENFENSDKLDGSGNFPNFEKSENVKNIFKNRENCSNFEYSKNSEKTNFDSNNCKNPIDTENTRNLKKSKIPKKTRISEPIATSGNKFSEKLKRNSSLEEILPKNQNLNESEIFCETELRKLVNFKQEFVLKYFQKDSAESEILKNIKTRIDEDFAKNVQIPLQEEEDEETTKKTPPNSKLPQRIFRNERNSPKKIIDNCPEKNILSKNDKIITYLEENRKNLSPETFRMKKSPKKSLIPKAIKSMKSQQELCPSNKIMSINLVRDNNFEWRNLELNDAKNSLTRNLIESVDSGIHTDFSLNEQRTEKNSFRSTDDSLMERRKNYNLFDSRMGFRYFDMNDEIFWSDDEAVTRKLEEVVEKLREELYQFEKKMRERINDQELSRGETVENLDFGCRHFGKPGRESSFTSWSDSSKNSFLSSGKDFDMNISSPTTLSIFTDSE